MFFENKEQFSVNEILAKTVFLTSLISFIIFLFFDLLRPGFVSNTFSVHWFLLAAIVSGAWWAKAVKK